MKLQNLIRESVKDLMNKPSDGLKGTNLQLTLMRKIEGNTAVYRLETDGWFRRFEGLGKGYGLMIRDIKISKTRITPPNSWLFGNHHVVLKVLVKYLPNEFDNMVDDVPENYIVDKGYLAIGRPDFPGWKILDNVSISDIENFVKSRVRSYKP